MEVLSRLLSTSQSSMQHVPFRVVSASAQLPPQLQLDHELVGLLKGLQLCNCADTTVCLPWEQQGFSAVCS